MEKNKVLMSLVMGILIGLIIGVTGTYLFMKNLEEENKENYEKEKLTITEKLSLEIAKLGIKNSTYTLVDAIENKISEINSSEEDNVKKIEKGMYTLNKDGVFVKVDEETNEPINEGSIINDISYGEKKPSENSVIVITEQGKILEAVFFIEDFKVKYDLLSTTVTKIGEETKEGE